MKGNERDRERLRENVRRATVREVTCEIKEAIAAAVVRRSWRER